MKKLLLLPLLVLVLASCSDDPEPDVRDQAVGTYTGEAKIYILSGTTLQDSGEPAESGSATVTKGSNAETILINLDGDMVTGTKVEKASNGFTFDLNSVTYDGTTFTGYTGFTLSGAQYDGAYTSATKKMEFFFQVTEGGVTYVVKFSMTKQ